MEIDARQVLTTGLVAIAAAIGGIVLNQLNAPLWLLGVTGLFALILASLLAWKLDWLLESRKGQATLGCGVGLYGFAIILTVATGGFYRGLELTIDAVVMGHPPKNATAKKDHHLVIAIVRVKNSGVPSVAEVFDLTLQEPGVPHTHRGFRLGISDFVEFADESGNIVRRFTKEDSLAEKVVSKPIATGAQEVGVVAFAFRTSAHDLGAVGSVWTLTCRDSNGDEHAATFVVDGKKRPPLFPYMPGLSPPTSTKPTY